MSTEFLLIPWYFWHRSNNTINDNYTHITLPLVTGGWSCLAPGPAQLVPDVDAPRCEGVELVLPEPLPGPQRCPVPAGGAVHHLHYLGTIS